MGNTAKEVYDRLGELGISGNRWSDETVHYVLYMLVEEHGPLTLAALHKMYITHFDSRTKQEFSALVQHWLDNRNFVYQGRCLRLTTAQEKRELDLLDAGLGDVEEYE